MTCRPRDHRQYGAEYGATMGFFPSIRRHLRTYGLRVAIENQVDLVERYCKEQGLWRDDHLVPTYSEILEPT